MQNFFRMSYFMPPIAPTRNKKGQTVTPATLTPFCEVSVEQVYQMITCNENLKALTEQVRSAEDIRMAKTSLLPYVTPCGTFIRRNSKFFASPSGLVVVDIDNLDSYQKAVEMRRTLFDDPFLHPVLSFISPSNRGVKTFVPYSNLYTDDQSRNVRESMSWAMEYVEMTYGSEMNNSIESVQKAVDTSGKDIVRACFLSHDPQALFREY